MARVSQSVEGSKTWIADEKRLHETRDYGSNQRAVADALAEQRRRVGAIDDLGVSVKDAASKARDEQEANELKDAYSDLKVVAAGRLECLETLNKVNTLETGLNILSSEFGRTATSLVQNFDSEAFSDQDVLTRAQVSQNSILALKKTWQHLQLMLKLADVHLNNASAYHQFHHDVDQYQQWMPADLARISQLCSAAAEGNSKTLSPDDTMKLLNDLMEVATTLHQWQRRVEDLVERSKKVVPVHLRIEPVDRYLPIIALCDYQTNEINVLETEELKLVENTNAELWKVQNMHGKTATVPSITCLIPGPDSYARQRAASLLWQLLKAWTDELKRLGRSIIDELNYLLTDWLKDDARKLRELSTKDKEAVLKLLDFIENVLGKHWSKHPGYEQLLGNCRKVRDVLNAGHSTDGGRGEATDVPRNTSNAIDSLKTYKDLLNDWDILKTLAADPASSSGQQLSISLSDDAQVPDVIKNAEDDIEAGIEKIMVTGVQEAIPHNNGQDEDGVEEEFITYEETMETEELVQSEQEEKRTFVITGVVDTQTGNELSMAEAIESGVIIADEGLYSDRQTGEKIPIAEAMARGLIKVEFSTANTSEEKRRDVGLITVTTKRETHAVTIKGAVEPGTGRHLSLQEAQDKGIVDLKRQCYHDPSTGQDTPLRDAIANNLIFAEDSDINEAEQSKEAEVATKTYAVYSVVDQSKKSRVPFSQAVNLRLIDKETGTYWHNVNDEKIAFGEAMKRGFIKASEVADPSSMDIAMENKAVAEKVDKMRKKLLNPMSALGAMSKMAGASKAAK